MFAIRPLAEKEYYQMIWRIDQECLKLKMKTIEKGNGQHDHLFVSILFVGVGKQSNIEG